MFAGQSSAAQGEAWADVAVRAIEPRDAERCAELLSYRTGRSPTQAQKSVAGWLESPVPARRMTLVAERGSSILGYSRADWLDPEAQGGRGPAGWYLTGLVVSADSRRHGVGTKLTEARLSRVACGSSEAWYFANERNEVSIHLHSRLGFQHYTRDFEIPGVTFEGGAAALFRIDLSTRI